MEQCTLFSSRNIALVLLCSDHLSTCTSLISLRGYLNAVPSVCPSLKTGHYLLMSSRLYSHSHTLSPVLYCLEFHKCCMTRLIIIIIINFLHQRKFPVKRNIFVDFQMATTCPKMELLQYLENPLTDNLPMEASILSHPKID